MDIKQFVAVDGTLYVEAPIEPKNGGCNGCSFNVLPTHNKVCDSVDCSGIIFKEAGLGGLLAVLAMTYKEE